MDQGNRSSVTKFMLLRLSSKCSLQVLLSLVFLAIYLVTLAGNLLSR